MLFQIEACEERKISNCSHASEWRQPRKGSLIGTPARVRRKEGAFRTEFFGITVSIFYNLSFALAVVWDRCSMNGFHSWSRIYIASDLHTFFPSIEMCKFHFPIWDPSIRRRNLRSKKNVKVHAAFFQDWAKHWLPFLLHTMLMRVVGLLVVTRERDSLVFHRSWLGFVVICFRPKRCYL